IQHGSIGAQYVDKGGDGVDHQAQIPLARPQSLFSLFPVIDVRKQEVPVGERTFRIPHWEAANLEPSVNAISAPASVLNVIDLPRFDCSCAGLDHAGEIVRMNDADESPVLQLLICFAEILQGLAVEKLDLAPCSHRNHEPGNAIDDLLPGQFPCAQDLLSPL